ncbi:MAG: HAD-IB family phosphatase [Acidimicrobiales bacterium]
MTSTPISRWPAFHHVIFDCDATLATVEGIDELAGDHPDRQAVAEMTDAAMRGDVPLDEVYEKRLEMLRPDRRAVSEIHRRYRRSATPGAIDTVRVLKALGHHISVVSGGLAAPVREFAAFLGIEPHDVHAVETRHDDLSGQWWRPGQSSGAFAGIAQSPLATTSGKIDVIDSILSGSDKRSILIGDGVSDLVAAPRVDLFVGFGGVSHRDVVERNAHVYLRSPSLLPIVALAAGTVGRELAAADPSIGTVGFAAAIHAFEVGDLTFNDTPSARRFAEAFGANPPTTEQYR